MKKLIMFISLMCSQSSFAEGVLLKANLDPREITLPNGYKFWSDIQAEEINSRPMREEIMKSSSLYLEGRISHSDFLQFLKSWSDIGFSQQERIVLADTLQKSNLPSEKKSRWLCRIDAERNCARIKIFPRHLSPLLQKYDWLVIDGQAYPHASWNEINILDENMTWVFLSSRFETYTFKGKWEDLKMKNPVLNDWISGNCENFAVHHQVQGLDNNVLLDRHCMKSSLIEPQEETSFYDKNKRTIWLAAGLVLGVGAINTLTNKKIILEKPSFR